MANRQNAKTLLLLIGLLALTNGHAVHCDDKSPFVAGYDRFVRHDAIDTTAGGRLLLSELSCTACHRTEDVALQPKRGPRLDGAADRLRVKWLKLYLASPNSMKPGTTMPDMLSRIPQPDRERAITALVAFLSSLHQAFPTVKATGANPVPFEFWDRGGAKRGRELFHQIGCVACHAPHEDYMPGKTRASSFDKMLQQLDPGDLKEAGLAERLRPVKSVPLGDLPAKYSRQALTHFLINPERVRPSGRMPGLKLTAVEAADIAAWLLKDQPSEQTAETTLDLSLAKEGSRLFRDLKCVNCHSVEGMDSVPDAKPLARIDSAADRSCLSAPRNHLPQFFLDGHQISSIRAALSGLAEHGNVAPVEEVTFRMLQLNCYACHDRNKLGGVGHNRKSYFETVGHVDLGDEGRIPPTLDGVGRKLRPEWLKRVMRGAGDIRPHMLARMPRFPAKSVALMPDLFAKSGPAGHPSENEVFGDLKGLAEAGRSMLNVGCVQCHSIRGESLPGVVGTDLSGVADRIHPEWFREFLLSPGQLKPRTRMPTFFPNGQSQNKELLNGVAERQIAATWAYLKAGAGQALPEKITQARSQSYELIPTDRPILLRTFMKQAGAHAIAVGFPQRVHFAFDAEQVRLAQAWRGRFLDAQGTWFDRFAPPAVPLGESLMTMPNGFPLAFLKDSARQWPAGDAETHGYRFKGYRIDKAGVPRFLYRFDRFEIEDHISAGDDGSLRRRLRIKPKQPGRDMSVLWFRANVGKDLQRDAAFTYTNNGGLTTVVSESIGHAGELRRVNGETEWIIPVKDSRDRTIEVQYKW